MTGRSTLLLAADIGGTSARFGLFRAGEGLQALATAVLATHDHPDFASLAASARRELAGADEGQPEAAVLAVAGPVADGRFCPAPNVAYDFDLDALPEGLLPARSVLVNDFTAQAHGCRLLGAAGSAQVRPGALRPELTQAVVGPGTGLGMTALVPCLVAAPPPGLPGGQGEGRADFNGQESIGAEAERRTADRLPGGHQALERGLRESGASEARASVVQTSVRRESGRGVSGDPASGHPSARFRPEMRYALCNSEGGHAAFPFVGPEEFRFQEFAVRALGEPYVRRESIVSGSGLALLHRFLTGREATPAQAAGELAPDGPVAVWFARFLARACRDYVLETLALGGLYVSGGVAAKNPMLLAHEAFQAEFVLGTHHGDLLSRVPVRLVADEFVGLKGAAALAATF